MANKQDPKTKQETAAQAPQEQVEKAPKHEETTSSKAVAADAGAADTPEIESLVETLSGDLSTIEPEAAAGAIDEWHAVLHKSKQPEIKELSNGLKQLKQALKTGKATGSEIGEILEHLGEQTSDLAGEAEKGQKTLIRKLGKQLSQAGRSIAKAEAQEHVEEFESLTEVLDEDLSDVDTEPALAAIDEWYAVLHKSDNESYKALANHLKQLKQALSGKGKGTNVQELLVQIGEQTVEAATDAPRGLKGAIQRFGKALSKAGKSIEV